MRDNGDPNSDSSPEAGADRGARYTLTARLPNREQAGEAVERLRAAGFAPADAVILDTGTADAELAEAEPGLDRRIFIAVCRDSLAGAWIGAAVGAVLGIGMALLPPVHDALGHGLTWRTAAIAAVLGAVAGVFGGSTLGMTAALDRRRAGSDTYDDQLVAASVVVGVRPLDSARRATALAVLRACGAEIQQARPEERPPGA